MTGTALSSMLHVMINFNFDLDVQEAENLGQILQDHVLNMMENLTDPHLGDAEKEWFKGHIKYLEALNHKILSSSKKVP